MKNTQKKVRKLENKVTELQKKITALEKASKPDINIEEWFSEMMLKLIKKAELS